MRLQGPGPIRLPAPPERRWTEPNIRPTSAGRQHYVPRLHLGRFEVDGLITAYDLDAERAFQSTANNLAVEIGYNDFQIGDTTVSTEDWLARLEATAAPILGALIERPSAIRRLSLQDELHLTRYLAAQKFRGPGFRVWNAQLRKQMVEGIKPIAKASITNALPKDQAEELWEHWKDKPTDWWLKEEEPEQEAEMAAYMLSQVQGWANLLRAMNWRIGRCPSRGLYTCDNPMSEYVPPIRPWPHTGAAIWEHGYVFPLSPNLLFWVYPMGYEIAKPRGRRWHRPFSKWETSVALHVVTLNATRFLFGEGPYITRECASSCLDRIDAMQLLVARTLQGFDPTPPKFDLESVLAEEPTPTPPPASR